MSAGFRKHLRVHASERGTRVDKLLADRYSDLSRMQFAKWIKSGRVTVDDKTVKPHAMMLGGERIEIDGVFAQLQDWESAAEVEFEVVYKDDDVLVVNKPAGLVVHPGAATVSPTLANGILARWAEQSQLARVGIVHRIDKDTSGLLVVAVSEAARVRLVDALSKRQVSRKYLAVVEGVLPSVRVVDKAIGRNPRNRTRQTTRVDGKSAVTRFYPKEQFRTHTLVEATLGTGRTHQIRVHASSIGSPLVGDVKYGAKRCLPPAADVELVSMLRSFPRQALHAHHLRFLHPRTGLEMEFNAELPNDLAALVACLAADRDSHTNHD